MPIPTNTQLTMTIDNVPVVETTIEESVDTTDSIPTADNQATPQGKPIPGMDIFSVVERSIMQQAEVGPAPHYAFIRNDIYLLILTVQPNLGPMRWVDESKGLDCLLLPFDPLEGQNQFKLAYSYEEAHDIYISSFPEGTFSYLPAAQAYGDLMPESNDADTYMGAHVHEDADTYMGAHVHEDTDDSVGVMETNNG